LVSSFQFSYLLLTFRFSEYVIPKLYLKTPYCVSCAIHARVVRTRPRELRRDRSAPVRVKPGDKKPDIGKPARGLKRSARRIRRAVASTEEALASANRS
jgi:hypothetical protein